MALFKIWDQNQNKWILVNNNGFSSVKIGEVYIDADGPTDVLNILEGDHVKILPNAEFDSVVISVKDIGDLASLPTIYKDDLVGSINELSNKVNNHGFVYNQLAPSSVWAVEHDLNRLPSVTIVDSSENIVIGDVQYVDNNNVIITFSSEFSGKAILN